MLIKGFRQPQFALSLLQEALNAILAGRDVFLVAPTGAGKSLCFQAPSLLRSNLTVAAALGGLDQELCLKDQVMALQALGIKAAMLSSSDSREDQTKIRAEMKALTAKDGGDGLRILYLTPERLAKSKLVMNLLEKIYAADRLGLLAIDEAHCISQWGHDFRQDLMLGRLLMVLGRFSASKPLLEDYERLAALRVQFPQTPILALTATATQTVAGDVQRCLGMAGAVELRAPTDRPNLFYAVRHRPKAAADVLAMVLSTIQLFPRGTPGLVYCFTRKEAEQLRQGLAEAGVPCEFYHGDLDASARQRVHSSWVEGRISVVVATVAFGMGINKSLA
eukprot:s485_g33.t1